MTGSLFRSKPSPPRRVGRQQAEVGKAIEAGARRLPAKSAWGYVKDVLGSIGSFNVTLGFTRVSATLGTTAGGADSGNTVCGIPQILKVSQYGAAEMFVWRTDSETDFFGGRELRNGERFDRRIAWYIDGRVQFSVSDRSIMSVPEADVGDT
jgi:hypothetical protein